MTVMLATFMEVLDTSVANVALPHIAGSLSATRRRSHLGAHLLPGCQRHRAAAERLVLVPDRPQALLHDLRGAVHRQLHAVRPGAQPGHPDPVPHPAGHGRRRAAAHFASHPGGDLSARTSKAWPWPSTAWAWWWRRSSARRWAAGSPTTIAGAGSSSSTFRSAFLSLLLTSLLIFDPLYLVRRAWEGLKIDYIGLGLLSAGLGRARNHAGRRPEERLVRIELHRRPWP